MRAACLAILVTCTATLVAHPATAQTAPERLLTPAQTAAVDQAVRKVMDAQGLVGVAIGVIRDGKIAYLQGYGWADREDRAPMTADTVINWASNSKPMAAILALQLAEKGRLDLDADVRRYVPEFPNKGAIITPRQILCHQSGIPHYSNGRIVPARLAATRDPNALDPLNSLDRFAGSPLVFRPGEKEDYSSYAYILLSAVIERAGQQPYDEQVRDRIRRPLGLKSLQLDHRSRGQGWASGYLKERGRVVPAPEVANDWKFGAGGYKSDVRDFAAWATALLDHRLVSGGTERMMWTPQKTTRGEETGFGLGFQVEGRGQKISHGGKQDETTTRMVCYPKAHHGIVVMSNCGFGEMGQVSTAIYAALSGKR